MLRSAPNLRASRSITSVLRTLAAATGARSSAVAGAGLDVYLGHAHASTPETAALPLLISAHAALLRRAARAGGTAVAYAPAGLPGAGSCVGADERLTFASAGSIVRALADAGPTALRGASVAVGRAIAADAASRVAAGQPPSAAAASARAAIGGSALQAAYVQQYCSGMHQRFTENRTAPRDARAGTAKAESSAAAKPRKEIAERAAGRRRPVRASAQ